MFCRLINRVFCGLCPGLGTAPGLSELRAAFGVCVQGPERLWALIPGCSGRSRAIPGPFPSPPCPPGPEADPPPSSPAAPPGGRRAPRPARFRSGSRETSPPAAPRWRRPGRRRAGSAPGTCWCPAAPPTSALCSCRRRCWRGWRRPASIGRRRCS